MPLMEFSDAINKKLQAFVPRSYQWPLIDAIETEGYKRVLVLMPRRSGKDLTAFNICIRQLLSKVCIVYYVFPTFAQAKRVIWNSINNEGRRVLDYIPEELIESKNSSDMSIRLINGSLFQLVGSDSIDALMGTNPYGIVFSEYALQDPRAFQLLRPIIAANDGWALFISTPRGRSNHLYSLYEMASQSPNWKCIKLSLDDTKHISDEVMDQERQELSETLIRQEYYCDFLAESEGAYYTQYIDRMRLEGRITQVPWEVNYPVHTAWDIGVRDSTTIIFFQNIGPNVHIIDCHENSKVGLEDYVHMLKAKPYTYGTHIAPHDIRVREFGTGFTRLEKARQLGINFMVAPGLTIMDGIEAVRSTLGKVYINEAKCLPLIRSLEAYRQEYDSKNKIYRPTPLHNEASHWADAMRYLAITLPKTRDGHTSAEDLNRRYMEAIYGDDAGLPEAFRKP